MALSREARLNRILASYEKKQYQTCLLDCAKAFQKLVRIGNADNEGNCKCVTCGKVARWNSGEIHAGHYYSRRKANTLLSESNCWPQCSFCNSFDSGATDAYRTFLEAKLGFDGMSELLEESRKPRTYHKWELAELKLQFLDEIKSHEKRLTSSEGEV